MKSRFGEVGGDAGKFKRETQKGSGEALTLKIVIISLAVLFFKVNRGQLLPGIDELGS